MIVSTVAWVIAIAAVLAVTTTILVRRVERRFPPAGEIAQVNGIPMHFIDVPAGSAPDLAPMVFLHGAGGNARDLYGAFVEPLKGRGRMIFIDRPGAGYSGRGGAEDAAPDAQATYVAGLLEHLGVEQAIIIGHSLGSSIAAAFAVAHPQQTAGLVFVAPATHPWEGAQISWYYRLAHRRVIGWLFAWLVAVPVGSLRYDGAVRQIFRPDRVPDNYEGRSATRLVLRPANFRNNAQDVCRLHANVTRLSPRYREIRAPAAIITGDSDSVVVAEIHSEGLARDIEGSRLVWLENAGHMPTYSHTQAVIGEIEWVDRQVRGDKRLEA